MAAVTTETKGAVRLIRYANPPRHYMTAEGSGLMLAAISEAVGDPAIRAIVLDGYG
jgi:enoyl-CoA hydratase/carnithine racemase